VPARAGHAEPLQHMVYPTGYTLTFWKFSLALSFRLFLLKQREEFVAVRVK